MEWRVTERSRRPRMGQLAGSCGVALCVPGRPGGDGGLMPLPGLPVAHCGAVPARSVICDCGVLYGRRSGSRNCCRRVAAAVAPSARPAKGAARGESIAPVQSRCRPTLRGAPCDSVAGGPRLAMRVPRGRRKGRTSGALRDARGGIGVVWMVAAARASVRRGRRRTCTRARLVHMLAPLCALRRRAPPWSSSRSSVLSCH